MYKPTILWIAKWDGKRSWKITWYLALDQPVIYQHLIVVHFQHLHIGAPLWNLNSIKFGMNEFYLALVLAKISLFTCNELIILVYIIFIFSRFIIIKVEPVRFFDIIIKHAQHITINKFRGFIFQIYPSSSSIFIEKYFLGSSVVLLFFLVINIL